MAVFAFTDAFVSVNSVDLSDHVRQVSVELSAEDLDVTAMSNTARTRIVGLKDSSVTIEFNQDFAASEVDATLWAAYNAGASVDVVVRADSAATSATNPQYTIPVLITDYKPLANSVGDAATVSVTWPAAGAITRAT